MRTALVAVAIGVGLYGLVVAALFVAGRRVAAREVVALLPNLARLFKGLLTDRRVSTRSKLLLALGMAWIASPIDLIPEFIPVLGPLDDAVVAALILRHVVRTAGSEVVSAHWHGDPRTLDRLLGIFAARPRA